MLEIARARARELGREVDLRLGDARALEFADQSFDTVVCTLSPARSPTTGPRSPRFDGCYVLVAGSLTMEVI